MLSIPATSHFPDPLLSTIFHRELKTRHYLTTGDTGSISEVGEQVAYIDVIIIGAGLSGHQAATDLQAAGLTTLNSKSETVLVERRTVSPMEGKELWMLALLGSTIRRSEECMHYHRNLV
jgi:hypothetical protein